MATSKKGDVELVVSAKNEATQTINELIKSLEELSKEAGGSGIGGIFKRLTTSSKELGDQQGELADALNRTKQAQDQLQKAGDARDKDLQRQRDEIDKTEKSLAQLNAKYDEYAAAANQARKPSDNLVKTFEKQQARQAELATAVEDTGKRLSEAQATFNQTQGVYQKATRNIEDRKTKVLELGQAWRETTQQVAQAQQTLEQVTQQRDNADDGQKQAQARLDALRAEVKEAAKYEKEKRAVVRESVEATDQEVKARDEAVAATKRLRKAVADQVLVEREARSERTSATKSYRDQSREVKKLTDQADRQKTAYTELKGSLSKFTDEQKKASIDRQRADIDKLNTSLEKLKDQYKSAADRVSATQDRLNKAAGPDPRAVNKFDRLKKSISETEQEIREQTGALEKLQKEYRDSGASADQLTRQQRELEDVTERLSGRQKKLQSETSKTAKATDRAGKEAAQTAREFRLWGEGSRQTLSFLQRVRGELLSIAAAYTGVYAIGGAIRSIYEASVITDKATARLTARLGDDQQQIAKEMEFVGHQADRLGISFGDLLDQYTRFLSAVPEGELSLKQIKFSFTAVAEAARVAGLSVADIQGVFVALSQLAGKGINLEDLRQQLQERIPGATEALRIGLSELEGQYVSLEDVLKRIQNSELSGAAIVPLAVGLRRQFEKGLPTAVDTAQAALGRFNSEMFRTRQEIAKSGFIENLIVGLKQVNAQLSTPEFKTGIKEFGRFLTGAIKAGVVLIKNMDTVLSILKAIIAVKIVGWLASLSTQIYLTSAASVGFVTQLKAATTWAGRAKIAIMGLYRALLLLPAAFYAGFAIGDQLQKKFPELRKVGATFVGIFEKAFIRIGEGWDVFLTQMKGGFMSVVKEIARAFVTIIPTVIWRAVETVGGAIGLVNEDLGKSIKDFALGSLGAVDSAADKLLGKLIDTSDTDAAIAEIRKRADEEAAEVDRIITQMFIDIDKKASKVSVIDVEKVKKDVEEFGAEFEKTLKDLDYTRMGSNGGRSIADSLILQLKKISRTLEEESATTLEQRLKVIATEFDELRESLANFRVQGNDAADELRMRSAKEIAAVEARTGLSREAREKMISAIRLRTESSLLKIQQEQDALSGASGVLDRLVALRQEKERQAEQDKQVEAAQKRINDITRERKDELSKVNELADLNLITTEEQGRRISEINDQSIVKLKEAVAEAKKLADETGNASLAEFADSFDGFENIERRRAAVENLQRLEQQINDEYSIRETKLNTLNALRENGAISSANAELRSKEILDQSNAVLGEMIDKAITLAEKLGDEGLVANLQNMKAGLDKVNTGLFDGDQMAKDFASGFTNAFNQFIDGTKSMGDAFRQFAADFLRQIANMILQQIIFNAVRGFMGGAAGGLNAGMAGAGVMHTGGIVGRTGSRRKVDPSWFTGAIRYHSGGVAGLKPNEVPTILEKGEEVLTATDPRHRNNQQSNSQPQSVKIVNAIDSSSVVSEGLNSSQGQKAILNFIRANKSQVKAVLT